MSKGTWAILKHYSSTVAEPKHDDCPTGEANGCSYQRDITTEKNTHPFTDAMVETMTSLFSKFGSECFLESVKGCYTYNPNEALNHVIWSLAPKEQFTSPQETSLAIDLAVCIFNSGTAYTLLIYLKCVD